MGHSSSFHRIPPPPTFDDCHKLVCQLYGPQASRSGIQHNLCFFHLLCQCFIGVPSLHGPQAGMSFFQPFTQSVLFNVFIFPSPLKYFDYSVSCPAFNLLFPRRGFFYLCAHSVFNGSWVSSSYGIGMCVSNGLVFYLHVTLGRCSLLFLCFFQQWVHFNMCGLCG